MVWRQEKILRTNLQPNPTFLATTGASVTVRTNLLLNPGIEASATNWVAARATVAYTAGAGATSGSNGFLRVTSTEANANYVYHSHVPGVTAGSLYTASGYVRSSTAQEWRVWYQWFDSSGTFLVVTDSTNYTVPANQWTRLSIQGGKAPANAARVAFYAQPVNGVPVGAYYDVDSWIIEQSNWVGPYFDGSSANGSFDLNLSSAWTGTAHNSASNALGNAVADWTSPSSSQGSYAWQAEDGKSIYVRNNGVVTWTTDKSPLYPVNAIPVSAGTPVSASVKVLSAVGAFITLQAYNASGTATTSSKDSNTAAKGTVATVENFVVPAGSTGVRMIVRVRDNYAPPGTTIRVTQAVVENAPTVGTYFDGNSIGQNGFLYRWKGTLNRTASDFYLPSRLAPQQGDWDALQSNYSETWYVDDIDIQSFAFGIEKADSTPPELRGSHTVIPNVSGVVPRFNRSYEPGTMAFKMWILGCDTEGTIPQSYTSRRQLFERNLQMLMRLFGYQGNTVTLKRRYIGNSDGDTSNSVITTRAVIDGFTGLDTMMARQRAELTVTMTLIDSFWSDVQSTVNSTGASATIPKTLQLTDTGTAPVEDAVIQITGPINSPKVTCAASGSWFQYNGTVAAGQTLSVNAGTGTATIGSTSVITNITHGGTSRLLVIPPRDIGSLNCATLTLTGSGTSTATNFLAVYNRKFMVML